MTWCLNQLCYNSKHGSRRERRNGLHFITFSSAVQPIGPPAGRMGLLEVYLFLLSNCFNSSVEEHLERFSFPQECWPLLSPSFHRVQSVNCPSARLLRIHVISEEWQCSLYAKDQKSCDSYSKRTQRGLLFQENISIS